MVRRLVGSKRSMKGERVEMSPPRALSESETKLDAGCQSQVPVDDVGGREGISECDVTRKNI